MVKTLLFWTLDLAEMPQMGFGFNDRIEKCPMWSEV